jgi:hypothetical protein
LRGRPAHDHWMNSPSSGQHTAHYSPVIIATFVDQFIALARWRPCAFFLDGSGAAKGPGVFTDDDVTRCTECMRARQSLACMTDRNSMSQLDQPGQAPNSRNSRTPTAPGLASMRRHRLLDCLRSGRPERRKYFARRHSENPGLRHGFPLQLGRKSRCRRIKRQDGARNCNPRQAAPWPLNYNSASGGCRIAGLFKEILLWLA